VLIGRGALTHALDKHGRKTEGHNVEKEYLSDSFVALEAVKGESLVGPALKPAMASDRVCRYRAATWRRQGGLLPLYRQKGN